MTDMVFFGILLAVYLLIGLIVVPIVFSDNIKEAEKKEDSDSANICAGLFVLVILWPLAHFIKKHNFRQ